MKPDLIDTYFLKYFLRLSLIIYLINFSFPFFSNIPLILLGVTGLFSICFMHKKKKDKKNNSSIRIYLTFFIVSFLISFILSDHQLKTLTFFPSMLPALIIFFLITEFFQKKDYHLLYLSLSASSMIVSIMTIKMCVLSENLSPSIWIQQTQLPYFIVPNDLIVFSIFIPYVIIEGFLHKSIFIKIFSLIAILLNLVMFVLYQSRSGVILSLMAIFLSLCLVMTKKKYLFLLIFFIVLVVIFVDHFWDFYLTKKILSGSDSWLTRLEPWLIAWKIFKEHPITGSGPQTFIVFYPKMPWAHNLYMETLAEQGIIGIISLLFLANSIIAASARYIFIDKASAILFSSSVILFVGAIIEFSFIRHFFTVVFFLITSMTIVNSTYLTAKRGKHANWWTRLF